jgi:AcrR family transcriptional regulator
VADVPVGRGEQTRQSILAAAIERFGRDGFRATAVTAIARDAGTAATAPYLYFPTKDALFLAAADDDTAGVVSEIFADTAVHPSEAVWPGLTMAAAMTSLERHPLARRILAGLEPDAAARLLEAPALAEARKLLATTLAAGQEDGRVRSDIGADELAGGLVGILLALLAAGVRFGLGGQGPQLEAVLSTIHASMVPGH